MSLRLREINKSALITAILFFILARPYFVWKISNMSYGVQGIIFTAVVELIISFFFFKNQIKNSAYKKKLILIFFFVFFLEVFFKLMRGWMN